MLSCFVMLSGGLLLAEATAGDDPVTSGLEPSNSQTPTIDTSPVVPTPPIAPPKIDTTKNASPWPSRELFPDERPSEHRSIDRATAEAIEGWVEELADDSYRKRETAARKLIKSGSDSISAIVPLLESGDLETTHRVISILHEISLTQSPVDTSGAWWHLKRLAEEGSGSSRQLRSAEAVEEIRDYRSQQATRALKKAGVYVGPDDFVVRAISQQKLIVQIDENWNGDMEAIGWLRWLKGVEYARVKGPAIRAEVLDKLSETVDLTTIAIVDGEITPDVLTPLSKMSRIHSLEFRYVKLDESMVKPIMELPIRVSLSMTGTGMPKDSVVAMREALPGLQIDCKEGGFLGVTCQQSFNDCQIQSVLPDSAADKAGLIAMDIVVGIDDEPVQRFEDLQQAIGMHFPGDTVTVKFRRGGKEMTVEVELGKLKER